MHITLSPVRMDTPLTVSRKGDILTINGTPYDFGPLPEGAVLPRAAIGCDWIISDVTRISGILHLTLILPHGPIPWPAPPEAAAVTRPVPITVTADGPVTLPTYTPPPPPDPGDLDPAPTTPAPEPRDGAIALAEPAPEPETA